MLFNIPYAEQSMIPVDVNKPFEDIQVSYITVIVDICCKLFDKAVKSGQRFMGSKVVFKEKKYRIFNFLFGYTKKAYPELAMGIEKPAVIRNISAIAQSLSKNSTLPGALQAATLTTYFEKYFDHLAIRRGNEVILDLH